MPETGVTTSVTFNGVPVPQEFIGNACFGGVHFNADGSRYFTVEAASQRIITGDVPDTDFTAGRVTFKKRADGYWDVESTRDRDNQQGVRLAKSNDGTSRIGGRGRVGGIIISKT